MFNGNSSRKEKRVFEVICLILLIVIIILLVITLTFNLKKDDISPETTENVTASPIPEPTEVAATDTPASVYVVVVTSNPETNTPNIMPTETPVIVITPIPTEVPTETAVVVITPDPTMIPTDTPIPTATPTPTPTPTPEPTAQITNIPTIEPTPETTVTPTIQPDEEEKGKLYTELDSLTMGGGIYPEYELNPTYDFYNYVSTDIINQRDLWSILKQTFLDNVVRWFNMDFSNTTDDPIESLSVALNSSICEECGRIKIGDNPSNIDAIMGIFSQIDVSEQYKSANNILVNFLYKYTLKNPDNPYERLFVACKGH